MPDEHLSNEEIDALREALTTLRDELDASLELTREGTRTVDLDDPIGRLSRIDAIQAQKMAQANKARMQARLKAVEGALARLERDPQAFGICLRCEEPIALERLRARPESLLCVACQEETEDGPPRRRRRGS